MRRAIGPASLLPPLGGCYVEPAGPGYGYGATITDTIVNRVNTVDGFGVA
jgi:hypothetical protein